MKTKVVTASKALTVAMAIGAFFAGTSGAQAGPATPERIKFPKGSIEVNLEKTVQANDAKRFVFAAKAGQEINFTITPKNSKAKLTIDFAGKTVPVGKLFKMIAPKTKDYQLQVTNFDDKRREFYFDIGIDFPRR